MFASNNNHGKNSNNNYSIYQLTSNTRGKESHILSSNKLPIISEFNYNKSINVTFNSNVNNQEKNFIKTTFNEIMRYNYDFDFTNRNKKNKNKW